MLSLKHNDSQSLGNYNDKAKRETVARVKAVNGQQNDQKVAHLVPKKSKEKDYTDMDIELIIKDINNTPRKSLGLLRGCIQEPAKSPVWVVSH
jgi:hypothetical protein